jgi:hypothetical protein
LANAIANVKLRGLNNDNFCEGTFRVFDKRWTYLTDQSRGFVARPVYDIMRHMKHAENLAFCCCKYSRGNEYYNYFVARGFVSKDVVCSLDSVQVFPLYLYPDENDLMGGGERKPNLDPALVAKFAECVDEITPEDILHYIYAVLYSPSYRERYREFLKTDFPRVPFPKSAGEFRRLAALGARLVAIHLMESDELDDPPATYPVAGDNHVDAPRFIPHGQDARATTGGSRSVATATGRVYINAGQYFGEVTERSWNFFIGGYQPAQKWLKDRKGRRLSPSDVVHYARILRALDLTAEIMSEIDGALATPPADA